MELSATNWFFLAVIGAVAAERLFELRIARRNTRQALDDGALELGARHYPVMVVLHLAFLVAGPLEVVFFDRPFHRPLAVLCCIGLVGSMALRYWVIATLGDRWTTRVLIRPGDSRVRRGPFQLLDHPNYLAVVMEMLLLPLLHTAWLTSLVFSVANGLLLRTRIRIEEKGLREILEQGTLDRR